MWSSCCVKCSTIKKTKKTKKIWRKKGINQKSTNKQEIKQRQSSVDRLPTVWKCRSGPIIIIIVIISAIRRYYVIFISYIAYHYTHTQPSHILLEWPLSFHFPGRFYPKQNFIVKVILYSSITSVMKILRIITVLKWCRSRINRDQMTMWKWNLWDSFQIN